MRNPHIETHKIYTCQNELPPSSYPQRSGALLDTQSLWWWVRPKSGQVKICYIAVGRERLGASGIRKSLHRGAIWIYKECSNQMVVKVIGHQRFIAWHWACWITIPSGWRIAVHMDSKSFVIPKLKLAKCPPSCSQVWTRRTNPGLAPGFD